MRIVILIMLALAVANLALGHWATGLCLVAGAAALNLRRR